MSLGEEAVGRAEYTECHTQVGPSRGAWGVSRRCPGSWGLRPSWDGLGAEPRNPAHGAQDPQGAVKTTLNSLGKCAHRSVVAKAPFNKQG